MNKMGSSDVPWALMTGGVGFLGLRKVNMMPEAGDNVVVVDASTTDSRGQSFGRDRLLIAEINFREGVFAALLNMSGGSPCVGRMIRLAGRPAADLQNSLLAMIAWPEPARKGEAA